MEVKNIKKVLIYGGKTGWIGGIMHEMCKEHGIEVYNSDVRIENRADVEAELDKIKPTHTLMAAGITGRPNIDWCEDHKADTIRTNVIGTLNVADLCCLRGIHTTVYATGCIFKVCRFMGNISPIYPNCYSKPLSFRGDCPTSLTKYR